MTSVPIRMFVFAQTYAGTCIILEEEAKNTMYRFTVGFGIKKAVYDGGVRAMMAWCLNPLRPGATERNMHTQHADFEGHRPLLITI